MSSERPGHTRSLLSRIAQSLAPFAKHRPVTLDITFVIAPETARITDGRQSHHQLAKLTRFRFSPSAVMMSAPLPGIGPLKEPGVMGSIDCWMRCRRNTPSASIVQYRYALVTNAFKQPKPGGIRPRLSRRRYHPQFREIEIVDLIAISHHAADRRWRDTRKSHHSLA